MVALLKVGRRAHARAAIEPWRDRIAAAPDARERESLIKRVVPLLVQLGMEMPRSRRGHGPRHLARGERAQHRGRCVLRPRAARSGAEIRREALTVAQAAPFDDPETGCGAMRRVDALRLLRLSSAMFELGQADAARRTLDLGGAAGST